MSPTMSVADLAGHHPVVSILFSRGEEPGSYDATSLQEFIDYELAHGSHNTIPYTMTDFFSDYLSFSVVRYLSKNRGRYGKRHFRFNISDIQNNLAKLAYINAIRELKLTENMIMKILPAMEEPDNDDKKKKQTEKEKSPKLDLEFRTFGILEREDDPLKGICYVFHELCIRDYLVALFLANECQRKVKAGREGFHLISSTMRDSMRKLPATGDIWRMTFGVMAGSQQTKDIFQAVLKELVEVAKLLATMSPFEITNMCVEAVYESQNAGTMADLLEDFTLNQTIRYSDEYLAPPRLPYAVSAVGYLVRSSGNVYGVHMSQFGLGPKNIGMLADPVNDVSDNNLQVLNLSRNPLGSQGMKGLLRFLVKATLLTHLDLGRCELGNPGVALLGEFFMCMPLRYLRLSENKVGDAGVRRMVRCFKYIPTLEWLDLSENNITDKGAKLIGEALPSVPYLRSLDLRRNQIGDEGAEVISLNMERLKQVTQLMLSENRIGEKGASKLSSHVWKTKSLRYVNLALNNIPEEGIMGLRKAAKDHGELQITVSSDTPGTADNEEGELIINPENPIPNPTPNHQKQTLSGTPKVSSTVNLLDGRDADFDRNRPLRRSWSGRGSFRRSWHGLGSSFRRNDHI
ncbi:hypothetical protein LSH36_15g13043 [Paralvinella palmiformis]|uniref:Uncharacterized protein n=1 Tax=Paralvinella palmiformis TaxID=53620 RepID=A0AAD9KCF2_9ANNE|nr:hypothetical protein LSH36_15g13043 [Paralvinella palmiformis]